MPIYEFYCDSCNTIYNFFSKTVNTQKIPNCPKCKKLQLKRQMSVFAKVSKAKGEADSDEVMGHVDETRMERAMAMLASEAEKVNEDDPRQAARLMRKLSEAAGLNMGSGMQEALSRLEEGEDPDKIEEEMGDLLEGEEPLMTGSKPKRGHRKLCPSVDDTLYDL